MLNFQDNLVGAAFSLDQSTGQGEPIRLVKDGSLITSPLDTTAAFPAVSKPILLTNVKNEAGLSIYGSVNFDLDTSTYEELVDGTFGQPATSAILNNTNYAVVVANTNTNGSAAATVDERPTLEKLGTDQIWRCPTWTFARNWIGNGGKAYVGMYVVGASYPGNTDVTSFCGEAGVVCHQDDIEIVVRSPCLVFRLLVRPLTALFFSSALPRARTLSSLLSSRRCKPDTRLSSRPATPMSRDTLHGISPPLAMFTPSPSVAQAKSLPVVAIRRSSARSSPTTTRS